MALFNPDGVMHQSCTKCGMDHDTIPRHPEYRLHANEDFPQDDLDEGKRLGRQGSVGEDTIPSSHSGMFTMSRPRGEWEALADAMANAAAYIEMTGVTERCKEIGRRLHYGAQNIDTMLDCKGWHSGR